MRAGMGLIGVAALAPCLSPLEAEAQSFGGSVRLSGVGGCVAMAHPPGERGRLFVLELSGRVRVVQNGAALASPFLDVSSFNGSGNGATGLAFDPDYARNGFVYVAQTTRSVSGGPAAGMSVARYQVSASDPNSVDPASRTMIIVAQPLGGQHTGGWIDFDSEGFLYISGGDAVQSTPSQSLDSTIGKILRIDVRSDGFPDDPHRFYSIPVSNPFAGAVPGLDEIWDIGLRNAFRCSFDRATGDLWIGDVGAGLREEISFHAHGTPGGLNFGWPCYEGFSLRSSTGTCAAPPTPFVPPVFDLTRSQSSCLIGGFIYRGCANTSMQGRYVFGNCTSGTVRSFDPANPSATLITHTGQVGAASGLYGFGEDADGELYFLGSGGMYRMLPPEGTFTDCNNNGRADACEIADGSAVDENNDGLPDSCTRRCPADFDGSGQLSVHDLFWYLNRYFSGKASADFNASGGLSVQDLFDFLYAYFRGCP